MQMKSTVFIGPIHTSPENPLPQQVGVLRVASPPKMRFASASWPKFLLILKQKRENGIQHLRSRNTLDGCQPQCWRRRLLPARLHHPLGAGQNTPRLQFRSRRR